MMIETMILKIMGEDAPVMTSENKNEIIATFQYVLYLCCTERERSFLLKRYGENMTYRQIADEVFLSPERVRQIIEKSLKKLNGYQEMLKCGLKEWHLNEIRKLEEQHQDENISKTSTRIIQIDTLNLSVRAYSCLCRAGIHNFAELTQWTTDILLRSAGKKASDEIISIIHSYGLKMADET